MFHFPDFGQEFIIHVGTSDLGVVGFLVNQVERNLYSMAYDSRTGSTTLNAVTSQPAKKVLAVKPTIEI